MKLSLSTRISLLIIFLVFGFLVFGKAKPVIAIAPVLGWTGELPEYASDGLNHEFGDEITTFEYRVRYIDQDGDLPNFVKVHIKKGGVEISGSPFDMNFVSGGLGGCGSGPIICEGLSETECLACDMCVWVAEFSFCGPPGILPAPSCYEITEPTDCNICPYCTQLPSGAYSAIYSYTTTLPLGTDYTYYFESQDNQGADAILTSGLDAPDVGGVCVGGYPDCGALSCMFPSNCSKCGCCCIFFNCQSCYPSNQCSDLNYENCEACPQCSWVPDEGPSDTTDPSVDLFNVSPTTLNIDNPTATIDWTVSDTGGSHLSQVEVWRAPDDSGSPGTWQQISTHPAPADSDNWTSSATDSPPDGIWWYGLHVYDLAGNQGLEPDPPGPIQVTKDTTSPSNPPTCDSLSSNPSSGDAPLTVSFTAQASDSDGTISEFLFDFGDGDFDTVAATLVQSGTCSGPYMCRFLLTEGECKSCPCRWVTHSLGVCQDIVPPYYPLYECEDIQNQSHCERCCARWTLDPGSSDYYEASVQHTYNSGGDFCAKARAKDDGGVWSDIPVTCTGNCADQIQVTVNYPDTTITSNPPDPDNQTTAQFTFSGTESPISYECQLDSGGWYVCTSPENVSVAQGSHAFEVKAINAYGEDSSPASYAWLVDTTDPSVDLFNVSPTTLNIGNPIATIDWTVSDTGGSHLSQVEVWRAPDDSGSPGTWQQISTHPAPADSDNWTSSATDSPPDGIWWYGLHVYDLAGNQGLEPDPPGPIQVTKDTTSFSNPPTADMNCQIINCSGSGCECDPDNFGADWVTYSGDDVFYKINNLSTDDNGVVESKWSILGWQDPFITCFIDPLCSPMIPVPQIPAGDYTIKLEVKDGEDQIDIISHPISIKQDAVADFKCSLKENGPWQDCSPGDGFKVSEGEVIYFKDYSSPSPEGTDIVSRLWEKKVEGVWTDFSPGPNSTDAHTTLESGSMEVRLTITDDSGVPGRIADEDYNISVKTPPPQWREGPVF